MHVKGEKSGLTGLLLCGCCGGQAAAEADQKKGNKLDEEKKKQMQRRSMHRREKKQGLTRFAVATAPGRNPFSVVVSETTEVAPMALLNLLGGVVMELLLSSHGPVWFTVIGGCNEVLGPRRHSPQVAPMVLLNLPGGMVMELLLTGLVHRVMAPM
jgi:hypothetical protein